MKDEQIQTDGAPPDLRTRTRQFALRIIRLYTALPNNGVALVLGKQILRSGTSVGAHYREGFRARSTAEFVSKLEVGIQELEESLYWLELMMDGGVVPKERLSDLADEAGQLLAILVTCVKNAKAKR
jgi:four helix bundle protein